VPAVAFRLPRFLHPALVLAACCAAAGLLAQAARQDANWDLQNYHLYNPWAWLTGRFGFDVAPAQVQTFHNPLLDVPLYAMVAADWPPRVIAFVMAWPAGIAAWFLFRIAQRLLDDGDPQLRRTAIAAALVLGLSGANGVSLLASSMNEWHVAAFVLASLWLLLREPSGPTLTSVVFAGLFAGLASGLKLTAATYAVGLCAALLTTQPIRRGFGHAFAFGVCVLSGLAITAGAWMGLVHEHFGSPLFPYFNDWLQSPLLPPVALKDARFGPKHAADWLTFPFELWQPPPMFVAEIGFRDARFPLLAALAIAVVAIALLRRHPPAAAIDADPRKPWRFVAVFMAVSFVTWAAVYTIYRYLLTLEALSGVAIVAALLALPRPGRLASNRARIVVLVVVTLAVVATTRYPNWGRVRFGEHWLDVQRPPVEANALVLLTADAPMAYVLTRFPVDARHVGLESNLLRSDQPTALRALAADVVDAHDGPIYQLTPVSDAAAATLARFGLRRLEDGCGEVRSNLTRRVLVLCRLERFARANAGQGVERKPLSAR
jgi:hypothetical protein